MIQLIYYYNSPVLFEQMNEKMKLSCFVTLHFHGLHGKGASVWVVSSSCVHQ
jgi:hypothetical protein